MKIKTSISILIISLLSNVINAQDVSTLVSDSVRSFEAIHWHPDGRIYSVDYANGELYQIFTDGTVQTLGPGINGNMAGGGFDQNGNFYFSTLEQSTGNVYRLNANNTYTLIASGFNQPIGILQSPFLDTLYVAQYGNSQAVKLSIGSGTITNWVSNNGINGPDAIIYNHKNEVLLANFNNTNIFLIDSLDNVTSFASLPVGGAMGYLTRIGSDIYVPAASARKIFKVDSTGTVTELVGNGSNGNTDGAGSAVSFSLPNGICSSPTGDTILVTDRNRVRMITNFNLVSSVQESTSIPDVSFFPNPVKDYLHVSLNLETPQQVKWAIYTVSTGQKISEGSFAAKRSNKNYFQIPVKELSEGNYVFKLWASNNISNSYSFIKID